ncbi:hypothetical protein [Lysobacter antibioticus]|uniref:hypothetical protein n=1 Tax=Lysobacter antibioticus TaxID=84531 RepID=UPI0004D0163C|nr:hypothetical protein [Lysobacter antibioticus]
MQVPYLIAAILAAVTGAVHSVLGEILIFRHLRDGTLVPALPAPPLRVRNVRIIWATWHLATLFGWAFAGVLLQLALGHPMSAQLAISAIVFAYLGGAVLVLVGTKGRHPGWVALAAVAALTAAGSA